MLSKSHVKYIQSLGQKKRRDEEAVFIAEGPKIVEEFLSEPHVNINEILAVDEWIREHQSKIPSVPITEIAPEELEKISQLYTPNKVLCIAQKIKWEKDPVINGTLSLALATIQDPGNLGTIIRTADWFGIKQVFCNIDCADVYNPKVVQASMGSIARVRVEYVELEHWLSTHGEVRVFGATLDGRELGQLEKLNEGIIVIGNESRGIPENILKHVNVRITIPGMGRAESLNASVATGIILSQLTHR